MPRNWNCSLFKDRYVQDKYGQIMSSGRFTSLDSFDCFRFHSCQPPEKNTKRSPNKIPVLFLFALQNSWISGCFFLTTTFQIPLFPAPNRDVSPGHHQHQQKLPSHQCMCSTIFGINWGHEGSTVGRTRVGPKVRGGVVQLAQQNLVGGFSPTPLKKYAQVKNWESFPQFSGWKYKKICETTTY